MVFVNFEMLWKELNSSSYGGGSYSLVASMFLVFVWIVWDVFLSIDV